MSTARPTARSTASAIPPAFTGLLDDAAVFPPGLAPLDEAVATHVARHEEWYDDLVASFVSKDVDVPATLAASPGPLHLSVVVTGGAGQVAGACRAATREGGSLAALEVALRDLDDLPGSARRVLAAVDAARSEGLLGQDVPVFVELPQGEVTHGWAAAADEVAARCEEGLRLKFRTGGIESHLFPTADQLAAWIDAALDRETPFKCTAGLHNAVRHRAADTGFEHHGFLNVLLATRQAFDGAGRDEVVATLEERDARALVALAGEGDLAGARRWFTSFGSCSVLEPRDDLITLGLLEEPA